MPNKEDILREKTFKGDVDELEKRIFYTLTDEKQLEIGRLCKAYSILLKMLHEKNILTNEEIDEILFETVM
jgi:hypothetical protein